MDFMHDQLADGSSIQPFNVIDDYNREGLALRSISRCRRSVCADCLTKLLSGEANRTNEIRCDNGPEYISAATPEWAARSGIRIDFIQPGQPQRNANVERNNGTVRYD